MFYLNSKNTFFRKRNLISSFFNRITYKHNNKTSVIRIPVSFLNKILGLFRITRRLFRLDMCNVIRTSYGLVIIRDGWAYHYNINNCNLKRTLKLKQCRNVLQQSICKTPNGHLFFGEYGSNPNRSEVNIYKSVDNGETWKVIYRFPKNTIRHVHGCYYDKFTNKIWTLTGDLNSENKIMISDLNYRNRAIIGDGSQKFRAVNLFFEKHNVHWIMDSPIEKCYQFTYNRKTEEITKGEFFSGPVWYIKRLNDGYYLACSSVETDKGVLTNRATIYASKNLKAWHSIKTFKRYFTNALF